MTTFFTSRLRAHEKCCNGRSGTSRRPGRIRTRLHVEGLEARALMASITEYPITSGTRPSGNGLLGITGGPDGNVYFTDTLNNAIGQITPSGVITELPLPPPDRRELLQERTRRHHAGCRQQAGVHRVDAGRIGKITTTGSYNQIPIDSTGKDTGQGPDQITSRQRRDALVDRGWADAIGELTTGRVFHQYTVPNATSGGIIGPSMKGITVGSDGNIWFTNWGTSGDFIGMMTPTGNVTEFPLPFGTDPVGIASGPDGNLWFTAYGSNTIDVMSTSGTILHQYPVRLRRRRSGQDITVGSDGNLYFTEQTGDIGEITTGGVVTITPFHHSPRPCPARAARSRWRSPAVPTATSGSPTRGRQHRGAQDRVDHDADSDAHANSGSYAHSDRRTDHDGTDSLDCFSDLGPVGHVHRDRQRLISGRGDPERWDGHLQRPGWNDRHGVLGQWHGTILDRGPSGRIEHRDGLLWRRRGLCKEQHGHGGNGKRQRRVSRPVGHRIGRERALLCARLAL